MEKQKSLWHLIPDEIKLECFSHLSEVDLCRAARVCTQWMSLAMDSSLWPEYSMAAHSTGNIPTPRVCHSAVTYNKKMVVYGGHNPAPGSNFISDVKNDMYEYDFESGEWKCLSFPGLPGRTEHTCNLVGDTMYIVAGYSSSHGYRNDVIAINPERREVRRFECKGAVEPAPRSAHTTVMYKNELFVFGGWDGGTSNNDFFKYNIERDEWSVVEVCAGEVPAPRRSHCATVYGNAMYVWGGFNGVDNCKPLIHKFDFDTMTWSVEEAKGTPPAGRSRAKCVLFQNRWAIFGGWDRVNHFKDWYEYDFVTRTWERRPLHWLPDAIGQHSAVVHKNKIYVFGGYYQTTKLSSNNLWVTCLGHLSKYKTYQQLAIWLVIRCIL
jgi:N-acetylneuraminic acid mutarotase